MKTTFLHTADWQLGKPFAGIKEDLKRSLLQQERLNAIERLGKLAVQAGAQFVLVAGDLFDSTTPSKATVSAACSKIGQIPLPVLVIPGNHDHGGPGCIWEQEYFQSERRQFAPNLRVLLTAEPVELETAIILPCPLLRRSEFTDPTDWVRTADFSALPGNSKPRIVLAHGSTQGFTSKDDSEEMGVVTGNLLELDRLPAAEIDYVALGDWHGTKQVGNKAWYSGTPEPDRFAKGSDHNPGNVLVVEVERGGTPAVQTLRSAHVGWHQLEHNFVDESSLDLLQSKVNDLVSTRTDQDLFLLQLSGSLGIEGKAALQSWLEALENRHLRLKLTDATVIKPTAEEVLHLSENTENPLIASVARQLLETAEGSNPEEALIARQALCLLHAASH